MWQTVTSKFIDFIRKIVTYCHTYPWQCVTLNSEIRSILKPGQSVTLVWQSVTIKGYITRINFRTRKSEFRTILEEYFGQNRPHTYVSGQYHINTPPHWISLLIFPLILQFFGRKSIHMQYKHDDASIMSPPFDIYHPFLILRNCHGIFQSRVHFVKFCPNFFIFAHNFADFLPLEQPS